MRICAIVKYPPIQGGVSARSYWIARSLAERGHQVHVVTNAAEVEQDYRIHVADEDRPLLEPQFPNGGGVSLTSTGHDVRQLAHIPASNPFVSKLSSLATQVIRRHQCELVFSFYYEPYSMAGLLASTWTNLPHVVQHAGSDRGRLMSHPELANAYRELLLHATTVVTSDPSIEGLGISPSRMARIAPSFLPRNLFTPDVTPLDVNAHLARVAGHPHARNPGPFRTDVATFGIIGKLGEVKGTYDLVDALARVQEQGGNFQLLALVAGTERGQFLAKVEAAGIGQRVWTLPLMPHWRVPSFVRACTAVCFLERDFPIIAHSPGIPREIMATGTCAVISGEIAGKQHFARRGLESGKNVLVVDDPTDIAALASLLGGIARDPEAARAIGRASSQLRPSDDESVIGKAYEAAFEQALKRHSEARGMAPARAPREPDSAASTEAEMRAFLNRQVPATIRLFSSELEALLRDEASSQPESEPGSIAKRAHRVVERLLEGLEAGAVSQLGLLVARFERDLLWLGVDLESARGIPQFGMSFDPLATPGRLLPNKVFRPMRSNWLHTARHPMNIPELAAAIADGAAPESLELQPTTVFAFHKRGDLSRRVFVISDATERFLELCDGTRLMRDILSTLAERGDEARGMMRPMVKRMLRERVLSYS